MKLSSNSNRRLRIIPVFHVLRKFTEFWRHICWKPPSDSRIILWENSKYSTYREFYPKQFRPRTVFIVLLVVYTCTISGIALFAFSRDLIPYMNNRDLHERAVLTSIRLQEMSDSLSLQTQYLANLQRLLSGNPDTVFSDPVSGTGGTGSFFLDGGRPVPNFTRTSGTSRSTTPIRRIFTQESEAEPSYGSANYLSELQLPAMPPVQGIITRGFNAEEGHYAIDIATSEGLMIRCIGDGYVIFSDWTYEGGHTIVVQHSGGYVSVYKHNQRLLKRTGDRVRTRESIAVSGDSGEYSSGPHLHFELWNNGLPHDPAAYLLGH